MNKKQRTLAFLCCLAYFASYMTRINYIAVRIAIADELSLTNPELVAELGIAITVASITYGLGQFISGALGDRLSPVLLVCAGLGGAVICNALMPLLYPSVYIMALVWGINGFFQSLIRPPLGRIISANYDEKGYIDTCVAVSNSSQIATILTYVAIPLCLKLFNNEWRIAFYLPIAIGVATLLLWIFLVPRLCNSEAIKKKNQKKPQAIDEENEKKEINKKPQPLIPIIIKSGLIIFIPPVLIHGLLRDGITAWMPDFISDVGGLGTIASILTTAILPIFCIICVMIAKKICRIIPSDGKSSAILFAISAVSAVIILPLLNYVNIVTFAIIVLLMALITGCMHGTNHIFITRMPVAFKPCGRVSGIVGTLNAITYVGGALSPYAVALIAGKLGWDKAVLFWGILAAISAALCILAARKWNSFKSANV